MFSARKWGTAAERDLPTSVLGDERIWTTSPRVALVMLQQRCVNEAMLWEAAPAKLRAGLAEPRGFGVAWSER